MSAPGEPAIAGEAARVEVLASPIHGQGLFATRAFAAGEVILVRDESRVVDAPHPLAGGEQPMHCIALWEGRVVLLATPERYVNHSCAYNTWVDWVDEQTSHLLALRPIAAGEEVTTFYPLNNAVEGAWRCACGTPHCLGVVPVSFFSVPAEPQWDALPYLAAWFVDEHAEAVQAIFGGNDAS